MKTFIKGIGLLLVLCAVLSCSRKKNNFLSRNWHAMTAKYNTLYNGERAFILGKEALRQSQRDNFWELLHVEPLRTRESVLIPRESADPNFKRAEEKAVKAIQRHSMLIDGRERNPKMDEAYLLLGKARYYDQRFIPALEAFNYILHKYPISNTINEAQLWREKTNVRLEFNDLAILNLKSLLKAANLERSIKGSALATLAQAYINISEKDSAVHVLKKAARLTRNDVEKGRYWFITGQLYQLLGKPDSADLAFREVVRLKRRTPRNFRINAQIALVRNANKGPGDQLVLMEFLEDLSKNRENRPFLDRIFFELANLHHDVDSTAMAIEYYNKSLRATSSDSYLEALTYETLGNIYFERAEFEKAGKYYDSTLTRLSENSRDFRIIKKKRLNLNDVIYYENLAAASDSILRLASLTREEQLAFFEAYTEDLLNEAIARKEGLVDSEASRYFEAPRQGGISMPGVPAPGSNFYFYNPTTVAYGEQEFFRVWGDRKLADNWRTASLLGSSAVVDSINQREVLATDPIYDPETYLARIPTNPVVLDSIASDRNFANYQLGLIYYGKFDEYRLAAEKLEFVIANASGERLILPARYHLYKIYHELGENARAQSIKNDILFQHPDSRYAAILKDPESLSLIETNAESAYRKLYELYKDQKYEEVIWRSRELIRTFSGEDIVPKLELLQAMADGRLGGLESFKKALNFVALNYPQSEEGRRAQDILDNGIPAMPPPKFESTGKGQSFKVLITFEKNKQEIADSLHFELLRHIEERNYRGLEVSVDVYNPELIFVVIHGFPTRDQAAIFRSEISKLEQVQQIENSFYISTPNYRIIQIHKNLNDYLNIKQIPPTNVRTRKKESTHNRIE